LFYRFWLYECHWWPILLTACCRSKCPYLLHRMLLPINFSRNPLPRNLVLSCKKIRFGNLPGTISWTFTKVYKQSSQCLKRLLQESFICHNFGMKHLPIWIVCFYWYCVIYWLFFTKWKSTPFMETTSVRVCLWPRMSDWTVYRIFVKLGREVLYEKFQASVPWKSLYWQSYFM
jgi:hypothetical protein